MEVGLCGELTSRLNSRQVCDFVRSTRPWRPGASIVGIASQAGSLLLQVPNRCSTKHPCLRPGASIVGIASQAGSLLLQGRFGLWRQFSSKRPDCGQRAAMASARSISDAPRASRVLMSRSSETVGSPASILATLDWLDLTSLAGSFWGIFS